MRASDLVKHPGDEAGLKPPTILVFCLITRDLDKLMIIIMNKEYNEQKDIPELRK